MLRSRPGFLWLDGADSAHYLFSNPLAVISAAGPAIRVTGPGGAFEYSGSKFAMLEAALEAWRGPSTAVLAGFLGYDAALELETVGEPPAVLPFPEMHFGLYDTALRYDTSGWTFHGNQVPLVLEAEDVSAPVIEGPLSAGPLRSSPRAEAFEESVRKLVKRIHQGDLFQANLCRCLETPLAAEAVWPLYQRLRHISPSDHGAFVDAGEGRALLSVSPELFLRVRGGAVESSPIKGTRPRGATPAKDEALAWELQASGKDRAELAMIVDVVRNDLGRVCDTGSIEVAEHARLLTLPTVHQLVSTVRGRLRSGLGPIDLLRAAFPAASISGAPKIEAMRAILREEGQARGPSMGAIGWISFAGDLELSVAIRTAFAFDGRVRYYTGCGITADSDPAAEFAESEAKALAFVRALGLVT